MAKTELFFVYQLDTSLDQTTHTTPRSSVINAGRGECPEATSPPPPTVSSEETDKDDDGVGAKKKVKAQTHYLFANGKLNAYQESSGVDSDDDYGGSGVLSRVNYAQSGKVRSTKIKSREELVENGVDLSSNGSKGMKRCTSVMDSGASHTIIKDSELLEEI